MRRPTPAAPAAAPPPDNLHAIIEREAVGLSEAQRWRLEQAIAWRLHELAFPGDTLLEFLADSPIPFVPSVRR